MSWRVIAGLLFLYLVVILLSGVMTETYFSGNGTSVFSTLLQPQTPAYTNPIGGISVTLSVTANWLAAFFQAIILDFPIFSGPYVIVRIFILVVAGGVIVYQVLSGIKTG
jgi:hypothetical protein